MKTRLLATLLTGFCMVLKGADETPPTIVQVQPPAGTVTSLTNISVRFSEEITGIGPFDLLVNGQVANSVEEQAGFWVFAIDQPSPGTVLITWDLNHTISDLEGNRFDGDAPSAKWQYNFVDTAPPVVSLLTPTAGVTVRALTQIEVQFNEAVSGVDAADLRVNGASATNVSVLGQGQYLFRFNPAPVGAISVSWAGSHGIRDFASPPNAFGGGAWSYTVDPAAGIADVRINEFVAANVSGLLDENAEPHDWIEIQNRGSSTVDLAGWSLTDDRDEPAKWVFPSTNLAPGQFLVVFASAKDRRAPTGANRFHTNFKLNPSGDYLALFNAESPRVAMSEFDEFPEQRNNHSYGYDAAEELKYFAPPTPGVANGASQISGIVPPPHFNVERGMFDAPFTLHLSVALAGAQIRYTTDATEPMATNGTVYTGPLQITDTTAIRAFASKTNVLPSTTVTHTYIFLESVLAQPRAPAGYPTNWGTHTAGNFPNNIVPADYEMDPEIVTNSAYAPQMRDALKSLPIVCLTIPVRDMFDFNNGIYTHPLSRGPAWERPCSMELFFPSATNETGFQVNAGLQIQGNAAREPQKQPKHPMRVTFKGDYGPSRLEYKMFPDSPVRDFDTLILRADFNFSWLHWSPAQRPRGQRTRDSWTKDTMRDMGGLASHNRYVNLYINGLYWGVYDPAERPDGAFAASYLGGEKEDYDVVNEGAVVDGNMTAYNAMLAIANLQFLTNYTLMQQYLDMTQFIDYMLLHFYIGHEDWGLNKNWYTIRKRDGSMGFKYVPWDLENILGTSLTRNDVTRTDVPSGLHVKLVASPEYRLAFADRVYKHLFNNGALTVGPITNRWLNRARQVELPIIAESARWGDYRRDVHSFETGPYEFYTKNTHWLVEQGRLLTNYFPQRGGVLLNQLLAVNLYPSNAAPVFSQHGGRVARSYELTITATNDIYYTLDGTDPREFGTSAVAAGASTYSAAIVLSNSVIVKARALFDTNWSALAEATFQVAELGPTIRITEIMYNPGGGDTYEYLVLKNVGTAPLNLGGYYFGGITYGFPPNSVIAAGATIILASDNNPAAWAARYPGLTVFGFFDGNLSNGGEKISINDPNGNIVYSLDYDDEDGWPIAADGGGASLKIVDAVADPDDPANWRTEAPVASSVMINELMADNVSAVANGATYPDWVELYNGSPAPVNLGGWSITDDGDARKYVFPSGVSIPGGGYLVVWCDSPTNRTPGLHIGFALGRRGETVSLFNASTARVDVITFGLQLPDYSIGQTAAGWKLNTPTPGTANIAAATASTSFLSINEWLANVPPGADDWVELFNRSTAAPVALQGIFIGTANTVHQINSLSFIAPVGFVQLFATEQELAGPDHLDFKLNAAGGSIILYDESAMELERVNYGPQNENVTQGRLPDGTATIATFPGSASPGTNNYVINYTGPRLNEIAAGLGWVELRNPNGTDSDISGMRLTTDLALPAQYVFPPGTTVAGNGYFVVSLGELLAADSGEVHLLNAGGQVVDSVVYGFQIEDMSIGRTGSQWLLLESVTPGDLNSAPAALGDRTLLRINEWMADPLEGNDWFEIFNGDTRPVSLAGLAVTDNPSLGGYSAPGFHELSFIGGHGFVRVIADEDRSDGFDHVNFALAAGGESLRLITPEQTIIDTVYFGGQAPGVSEGRVPDGSGNFASFPGNATPAASNYLPLPNARINEVLANPVWVEGQAIEIYNPSSRGVDIGNWYLSNHPREHKKFRFRAGTFLPAGGYMVFWPSQVGFTLGGYVSLSEADSAGNLSGRRSVATFGQAPTGQTFGTIQSCTGMDFAELNSPTLGAFNARARVGPVLISEIMYHPPTLNSNENNIDEYIELHNQTAQDVALDGWELRNAVGFTFPADTSIPGYGFLVVVGFDPAADLDQQIVFRSKFGVPDEVAVIGPWRGNLSNAGEMVELYRPVQILVERVGYDDAAPWPTSGDGDGNSLQRSLAQPFAGTHDYGNDALNWYADSPTGGSSNLVALTRAPVILAEPLSRAVPAGTRVEFNVAVCGALPIGYLWEWDGGFLGEWHPSFVIESATATNAGIYRVALSNQYSPTIYSAPARLIIQSPPAITQQPVDTVAPSGTNVTFTVSASGTGPFTYQWRRNGMIIHGETNQTLELFDVQVADSGDYSALVANIAGAVASDTANLEVFQRVRILTHPQSRSANTNTSVSFTVNATGTGTVRYQWRYFGQDLLNQTNATLTIPSVQLDNSGDYTVVAYDSRSSAESLPATLTVLVRPFVTRHPVGLTVAVGSNVTLSVGVNGGWPITNRWRRNFSFFTTNVLAAKETNASLTLTNIQTNQAAAYALGLQNVVGSSFQLSGNAHITVVVPPTNTTAMARTDVQLRVQAFSGARILYQWKAGNADIPGATNALLVLTNVQMSQSGTYSVVVSAITNTVIAPATFSANLTVEPGPPLLSDPRSLPGGAFEFLLTGDSNQTYGLQFSPNLTNWATFTNISYTNGPVTITDPAPAPESRKFYRAFKP
jgi:hypothetical protein